MRICLLTTQNLDADPFPDDDWPCDPRPYLPDAEWELTVLRKPTAVRKVIARARRGFDLFFNLCDGAWDEDTPGIEVVQTLERLGVPFTGATSRFYEPSREVLKRVCGVWGVDTPAYAFARGEEDLTEALDRLRFPMIVKHPSSYASVGLTPASRVTSPGALRTQVRRNVRAYGGALIEEFIEGTECTVLVAENPDDPEEPTTYPPVEFTFPEGESFKHADAKWVDYAGTACTAVADPALAARLRESSTRLFLGLEGAGYGRCDFRLDLEGRPFVLEMNANCGVYYPPDEAGGADACLAHDPDGHAGFTRQVVAAALRRHARRARPWVVRPRRAGGHGLFATRPVRCGERIVALLDERDEVVPRSRVERDWGEARRARFWRHAWPLSDELWVAPGRDPEGWRPIGHACEPSAWLEGLDVVARRALGAGEEITLDYATYRDERMSSFPCTCRTPVCRGTVRGSDHLRAFVARYGDHVSEHVRRKRAAAP